MPVTIVPHTTRATGTVLTAAIYNADHQNHVTNAASLNAAKASLADTESLTNKTLIVPIIRGGQLDDSASDHRYIFVTANLAASRNVNWPLLLADDTLVFANFIQTLLGKTLTAPIVNDPIITAPIIRKTDDGSTGVIVITEHVSTTPAAQDTAYQLQVKSRDAAAALREFGSWILRILDTTAASIDGVWEMWTAVANTIARRVSVGAGLFMEGTTDPGVGKINAVEYQVNGVKLGIIDVAPVTLSGTVTTLASGIPAGVKMVVINFDQINNSLTSQFEVQIGDSGGFEATGYDSGGIILDGGSVGDYTSSVGFEMSDSTGGAASSGQMILSLSNPATNRWTSSHQLGQAGAGHSIGSGIKSLSAALTQIRITCENGTDTISGTATVHYFS